MPSQIILDPTDERTPHRVPSAPRLSSLAGKRVGLLDISKPKGNIFLDRLEQLLTDRYGVGAVHRFMKPTFTKPAPRDLRREIAGKCDAVIEALAD